jgi:COMPASS component SWD1
MYDVTFPFQEDEAEIAKRKMKQEEDEVDIDSVIEDAPERNAQPVGLQGEDEDLAWADEDPDDDEGEWKMKIIMEDSEAM